MKLQRIELTAARIKPRAKIGEFLDQQTCIVCCVGSNYLAEEDE